MNDQFGLSAGRDWSTPMPMTGKLVRKTFFDWNTHRWMTCNVIELGVREFAPSMSYAERMRALLPAARPQEEVPPIDRAPAPERPAKPAPDRFMDPPRAGSRREAMHAFIRAKGRATASEIAAHLRTTRENISSALVKDGLLRRQRMQRGSQTLWSMAETAGQ